GGRLPVTFAALAATLALTVGLPQNGVLAPARSLAGVRLGDTQAAVRARWGSDFGRCRDCKEPTWYFTYARFQPQGAGVAFRKGRVTAVFTLWSPEGWRTTKGLFVGDSEGRAITLYGAMPVEHCAGYDAFTLQRGNVVTVLYISGGTVYGFGLMRAAEP